MGLGESKDLTQLLVLNPGFASVWLRVIYLSMAFPDSRTELVMAFH